MLNFRQPDHLAAVRTAAGLTKAELARRAGISRDTIERIEAGSNTWSLRTFEALERALIAPAQ